MAPLVKYAGERDTGSPKPPQLVGAEDFRRSRSVGTRRRRESLRTIGFWSKPTSPVLSTRPESSMPTAGSECG